LFFEQWQFPRGGVCKGESDLACARREFDERPVGIAGEVHEACRAELHYVAQVRGYEIERTIIYFLAAIGPGELRLGNDNHGEARWVATRGVGTAHRDLARTVACPGRRRRLSERAAGEISNTITGESSGDSDAGKT
jgi:hypothetical protein